MFHELGVGWTIDECHDFGRPQSFGQHGREDIGFFGIGQGNKDVATVDVFFDQKLFVGGITSEHDGALETFGDLPRPFRIAFDELDLVVLLQSFGE